MLKKKVGQIFKVIQQGLAPQTVSTWSTNHTILPRTAILRSPTVRPIPFLKGLDLIIRNGSANHCQRWEIAPISFLSVAGTVAKDHLPSNAFWRRPLKGNLGLRSQRKGTRHEGAAPERQDLLSNDRNTHLHRIFNERSFKQHSHLEMPV